MVGFEPIADKNSKILILGSFPSVKSREIGFYYGNKQNRLWKILAEYFDEEILDDPTSKTQFLLDHNLAMWDIVKSSDLLGSSDVKLVKDIQEINDISLLLKKFDNIKVVFCNGKASFNLTKENFCDLNLICLPSTSPANVSFDKKIWFENLDFYLK